MDPALCKDVKVKRGYTYHYYHTPPTDVKKPTLLFIHGFPSTSRDWTRQVVYFKHAGYGVLVPDCLGYGGTSKPTDPTVYRVALIATDIMEIVEEEGLKNVVAIGHDWGSIILSRVADLYADRFLGFAWLAVSYFDPPMRPFDLQGFVKIMRSTYGRDMYGYWELLTQEDAHKICEKNLESFHSLAYPTTPELCYEWLSPWGKMSEWIKGNRTSPRPEWMTEEEYTASRAQLASGGLQAPFCYYRAYVTDCNIRDSEEIVKAARKFDRPVLYFAASRDAACDATLNKAAMSKFAPHVKIVELDTGHWIMFEATERLNAELEGWVKGLVLAPE